MNHLSKEHELEPVKSVSTVGDFQQEEVLKNSAIPRLSLGQAYPLGASVVMPTDKEEQSVNFAIYSPQANQIELCLFDQKGNVETSRFKLHKGAEHIWHGNVTGIGTGQLYGFRVYGDNAPERGLHFNPNNLLIDPYAKDLYGPFSYPDIDVEADNAACIPKSRVTDLQDFKIKYPSRSEINNKHSKPNIPWRDTVIYECHVKGATINNFAVAEQYRGKFLGLAEDGFINHIKALGVTTLELLPVHSFISERFLVDKKLTNYWGYNSVNFFTPHHDYLCDGDISEFQCMVSRLHQHDIEVIIDVVFNHTAEGNHEGQTFNLRGLANSDYYSLDEQNLSHYINDTGCGNTLNMSHPRTLQLVMDSLRYWVEVMGVDGFRFDLATILARDPLGFNYQHTFFQSIAQDPVLNKVKMIAEPWDIGPGGYQLGAFPVAWREWNDKYRDTVRRFWRGDQEQLASLAKRLHGSNDLFSHNGRDTSASINFITAHDGYTLADLVSFEEKHNLLNGENNRDGHNENYSHNNGFEGETENKAIIELRVQQQKNMLFTLIFSQGVPMLSAGMEQGHSQQGNNNAYCQDNAINYLSCFFHSEKESDMQNKPEAYQLFLFTRKALKLRKRFSIFKQSRFIHPEDEEFDWCWLTSRSESMLESDWKDPNNQLLICLIVDKKSPKNNNIERDKQGNNKTGLLMIFNASDEEKQVILPHISEDTFWHVNLHSLENVDIRETYHAGNTMIIPAKSVWLMSTDQGDF